MKGQRLLGVEQTPELLYPFYNKKVKKIYNCPISDNLHQNLYNLYKINKNIEGKRLNIGGDHSMSISTIADSLNRYDNLRVIWIDAHPDINTFNQSKTKNFHGMPLSILTGIDNNKIYKFNNHSLNYKNLLYLGIRDIDDFEKKIIDNNNISSVSVDEINNNLDLVIDKIYNFSKNYPIHLSFDVDCLDPIYMPCTGTPVSNGINLKSCKNLIQKINEKFNIVSIDITELNLKLGNKYQQDLSLKNFLKIFGKYL